MLRDGLVGAVVGLIVMVCVAMTLPAWSCGSLARWSGVRQHNVPEFAGVYDLVGDGPLGAYRGTVSIAQRGPAVYERWEISNGQVYGGFGVWQAPFLAVGYADGLVGAVVVYRIDGAQLHGVWPDETGTLHSETLTRRRGDGIVALEGQQQ